MQELESYLEKNFKGFDITDSFIDYLQTLHIELEDGHYQLDEYEETNPLYFNAVYTSAKQILHDLIGDQDELFFVFQTIKERDHRFKRVSLIDKFTNDRVLSSKLKFSKINRDNNEIHQIYISCKKSDLKIEYLIRAICNQDFPNLEPRLKRYYGRAPEIFIINKTTDCILHFYDDRGCFILTRSDEKFEQYKDKYKKMILEE
ncbi:DUF3885 domain-containing protein [Terribacillus sp. DMT04]|uniref:DUF3885 domain-containing protein n=1 Tax=Terribacillus sp. DMT04 TaxID=2850441 RepID=UPI001C2B9EDC|nr:DUF3885 domain-containing protein [Terribacillus sp. DMT04]QXE02317.1 DUF3885 domain-containing protein [Terribacillus sp. DMT04]